MSGDFNADSRLDIATAGQNGVSVLLGDGQGGFGVASHYAAGSDPRSLATGDFNADGKLDLAAANGAGGASVLLGNGDGSLRAPVTTEVGSNALSVAVGDFNADGRLDLAVTSQSEYTTGYYGYYGGWYTRTDYRGHVNVLLGNGQGGFASWSTVDLNSGSPVGVAVADFNMDGRADVAAVNEDRGTVSVLMGNGDGTLRYTSWTSDFATGWSPRAVTVGDFTGDGKLDLATAGQTVNVLPGLGDGTFQPVRPTYVDPAAIAAADFNGDGRLDVVTADPASEAIDVLLGRGTGTFTPPVEFIGSRPTAVAVGDFNRDGRMDVAAANAGSGTVSVLLNDGIWPAFDAPTVSVGNASVVEGNTGLTSASFTVTLSAAHSRDVTVRYETAAGYSWAPATVGTDVELRTGQVTIRAGFTTATVVVSVLGDRTIEDTEYFFVRLSDPANAFIADGIGEGMILDDEPRVSVSGATAAEGNDGTRVMTFTVMLSAAYDAPFTVAYATSDASATAGEDYRASSGTLTFAAGETSRTLDVTVYGDRAVEYDEYFFLVVNETISSYGLIVDDEPRISISSAQVGEGNSGTSIATFTVSLSIASETAVSVNFSTAEGDTEWWYWGGYYYSPPPTPATSGVDFQAQSGTLTFAPGETSKTIRVLVTGDRIVEPDEAFSVNLSGASGGMIAYGHAVGTIVDDEPRISVNSASLREGSSGVTYMVFTVSLSVASTEPVTVRYATQDGGATAGVDYEAKAGTLTFAPGETTKTVSIAVYGDSVYEYDEYFYLTLSDPSLNAAIGNGWGYGSILNDDSTTGGKGNKGKGRR